MAMATTAHAGDQKSYVGVGGIMYDTEGIYGLEARAGYSFLDYLGVEAQASFGIIDIDEEINDPFFGNFEVSFGISSSIAGFAVGRVPVSEKANVFVRIGHHSTELSIDATGISPASQFDTDGLAFGGGIEYFFDGKNGIRAEYTNLDLGDTGIDSSLDTVSLGYTMRF